MSDIVYTRTDESPMFASYSLFPILQTFLRAGGIEIVQADIGLAARIIAAFNDKLPPDFRVSDDLEMLRNLTQEKRANIIKLPNISASLPQLNAAITELRAKGYDLPPYPSELQTPEEKDAAARYAKVLGSAVNPVLREGNSDRRCVSAVKRYARENPYKITPFEKDSKTEVAYMKGGDFYSSERSISFETDENLRVEFISKSGEKRVLKENLAVEKGDIIDASFMSARELDAFIKEQIVDAKAKNLLFSVHLKASMMKVSDPVIFGHFVKIFFAEVFDEFADELKSVNVSENNGLKDLFARILNLPQATQEKIKAKFEEIYTARPNLAMVNSAAGITNLHVPSDVIIDASMPAMIKNGGKMWDKEGIARQTKAVIPDKTYAVVYEAAIADIKANGALDPAKIGSVSNVGLMAKKAEEYGSHDKTFVMSEAGEARVLNEKGEILFKFELEKGDIFRMTQVKDVAVRNWVELALKRAKITGQKAIFWLDENRAHDREILKKVRAQLASADTSGLDIEILSPAAACKKSLEIMRRGEDCISVTGNVLRDYLTDLFPILELETSAKMLSIVPLLEGGSIFETGAGGSAPRLAEQLLEQNHLSWDSLGEFLALGASLEQLASFKQSAEAQILADTLNAAVELYLKENKVPRFEVGQLDTRTSHFYIALYWASELAASGTQLGDKFKLAAQNLAQNESAIVTQINAAQGRKIDLGGYYKPDDKKASAAMRPSATFNQILQNQIL